MQIELDWNEDYLEYRQERGLGEADPGLVVRLGALIEEARRLGAQGRAREAGELVQWLLPGECFLLRDPQDDSRYECHQGPMGGAIRVVSGYAPEEVELEPREMPEATLE